MATETTREQATGPGLTPYRITVRQFEQIIDAGVFAPAEHVELLAGILFENPDKMTQNEPHGFVVNALADLFRAILDPEWFIREEKPILLGRTWRPEPDIAAVRGPRARYWGQYPRSADLGFVAEVSDTTYAADRGTKWRRYAAAGIPIYWIVHIPARRVEVHGDPAGRGKSARYRVTWEYTMGQDVPVEIERRQIGRIAVNDLFPADVRE